MSPSPKRAQYSGGGRRLVDNGYDSPCDQVPVFVKSNRNYGLNIRTRCVASLGPIPKLKLFWNGTLMRLATGFWVSLASSSVLDSCSLEDSAAFALKNAKVSKIATKELATRLTQAALIGVLFIGFLFFEKTNKT